MKFFRLHYRVIPILFDINLLPEQAQKQIWRYVMERDFSIGREFSFTSKRFYSYYKISRFYLSGLENMVNRVVKSVDFSVIYYGRQIPVPQCQVKVLQKGELKVRIKLVPDKKHYRRDQVLSMAIRRVGGNAVRFSLKKMEVKVITPKPSAEQAEVIKALIAKGSSGLAKKKG